MNKRHHSVRAAAIAMCAGLASVPLEAGLSGDQPGFDPLFDARGSACLPGGSGRPRLFQALVLAQAQATASMPGTAQAAKDEVPLYRGLGSLSYKVSTRDAKAQAYFDQGLRLAFGFNHAEAQRAFRKAQQIDPNCAMCFWGEALVLGPNINAPMMPEANAPALAALSRALALKGHASERDRALIEALEKRYSADPKAERAALDKAYADAMLAAAARFPGDDTITTLFAEAAMDTQPWDYWESGGVKPKGRGGEIVRALEKVLARNPQHIGAIHLYIHAVEASNRPERALPAARRLEALAPGAGHLVHMPAHIYVRLGQYRESMRSNVRAVEVDEVYFKTSPSDPLYRSAYYPHNIHFVMVSAHMGGDGATALGAAAKLDASLPNEAVAMFAILQPVKAAPYATQAQFAEPAAVLALPAPPQNLALVRAMYHYARALAYVRLNDAGNAQKEIDAIAAIERSADFKPFDDWGVPARSVMQVAQQVASGKLADAGGRLDDAVRHYQAAVAIEDSLPYTEPPYWYYPVRQSLGAAYLRQGKLDDAQAVLRDSLQRVHGNGWALAALVEVERKRGDAKAESAARGAYQRAWFGPGPAPEIARL